MSGENPSFADSDFFGDTRSKSVRSFEMPQAIRSANRIGLNLTCVPELACSFDLSSREPIAELGRIFSLQ